MVGYKLDTVIKELLSEMGEQNMNKYSRILPIAISGLRELNMDVSGVPKIAELEVSSVYTAPLPSDYIRYSRIAVCGNDGNLYSLGINENMCLNHHFDDCGNEIIGTNENELAGGILIGMDGIADNMRNGELTGRLFGLGGGNNANGYYKIDNKKNVIQFGQLNRGISKVILEYLGTLESIDGSYIVHPFIVQSLKSWIRWQLQVNNPNSQLGRMQIMESTYRSDYRNTVRRYSSSTIDEWVSAIRLTNSAAPKY